MADAQLLRLVRAEADGAGAMGLEVLRLGREPAVGAGEEELVGEEAVECRDVGGELRGAELGLERDDLRVGRAAERRLHRRDVGARHP